MPLNADVSIPMLCMDNWRRRRVARRACGRPAVAGIHERGEKIADNAVLAETTESEVRSYLKFAQTRLTDAGAPAPASHALRPAEGWAEGGASAGAGDVSLDA